MSSYHSSFTYLGKNSAEYGYMIASFDADSGEHDTFLGMDQIYTESYDGRKRNLYGSKHNTVATIDVTLVKIDRTELTMNDNRTLLRWLTSNPRASWLDFYVGDNLVYSFFANVTEVQQQKLDARVIGLRIHFESVSPWAYSGEQKFDCRVGQGMIHVNDNRTIYRGTYEQSLLNIDDNGVLFNDDNNIEVTFDTTENDTMFSDSKVSLLIDNQTDDLYSYINLDVTFENDAGTELTIQNTYNDPNNKNESVCEITKILDVSPNEVITLSSGQFIQSSIANKIFGDTFTGYKNGRQHSFVWPRLAPGENNIVVDGLGRGYTYFSYRYPIKIGDCSLDVDDLKNNPYCEGELSGAICSADGFTKVGRKNIIMIDRISGTSYSIAMYDGSLVFSESTSVRHKYNFAFEDLEGNKSNEISFINRYLYITTNNNENKADFIHDYIILIDEVTNIPYKIMVKNNSLYFIEA